MEFKHVSQSETFPGLPDGYSYENEFDYQRWAEYETEFHMVNVPWGTSEVAVGQRVYGGFGKVVKFESDATRDAYFNGLSGYSQVIPYRGFSQEKIVIELPFDMAMQYNYAYLNYNPATSEDALIGYEGVNGVRRIYYFIRDIKYLAPNSTELVLLLDYWTTFVNSLDIKSLGVERGHVADAVTPAQLLANPRDNSSLLMHEDVSTGELGDTAGAAQTVLLNGETQYAVIAATANLQACIADPSAVKVSAYDTDITPNYYMCAVSAERIGAAINAIKQNLPNYVNTIKGVYLVSSDALLISSTFDYSGVTFYNFVAYPNYVADGVTLAPNDFPVHYTPYANLAKLYTWPYSALEVSDYFGNTRIIKIQDIGPNIGVEYIPTIAAPTMAVGMALLGVGDSTRSEVSFNAIRNGDYVQAGRETMFIWEFDIPCFAVSQAPLDDYLAHSAHDRAQAALEATTNRDNAIASANAAYANQSDSASTSLANATTISNATKANAYRRAEAAKTNADRSATTARGISDRGADNKYDTETRLAQTIYDNAVLVTNHASQQTSATNEFIDKQLNLNLDAMGQLAEAERTYLTDVYNAQLEQITASGFQNAVMGAVSGATAGAVSGAMASGGNPIVGAVAAIPGAVVGAINAQWQTSIAVNNNAALYVASWNKLNANYVTNFYQTQNITNEQMEANRQQLEISRSLTTGSATMQRTVANNNSRDTRTVAKQNSLADYNAATANNALNETTEKAIADLLNTTDIATATATANTQVSNAGRTRDMQVANAGRSYDTAVTRIANTTRQRGLDAPATYGAYSGNAANATRPQGLKFQVVSQAKGDLATAGNAMLRYGYYVNQWFDFTTFNVKPKFSYWKCFDFNIASSIPDAFADRIKVLLMDGITVYSKPEYVNETGIFDNE